MEKVTYTGTSTTASFVGTGNAGDNIITGSAMATNNLYGGAGNDKLYGGSASDVLFGEDGADELHGGEGNDAASYATATAGVTVDLKTGANTGAAAGDTYDSIERFIGSNYNDTFVASAGADNFTGAGGTDTVDYSTSSAAVNVNLTTNVNTGGDAQGDSLTAIERVVGSNYNDTLSSSTSGHSLWGGAGDDLYIVGDQGVVIVEAANGGTDEVQTALGTFSIASYANVETLTYTGSASYFVGTGNAGNNVINGSATTTNNLYGGAGNDKLYGGSAVDVLYGEDGADELHGGGGTDTASYATASASVIIDLKTGNNAGAAAGDTYDSIERFEGSTYNDTFIASAGADTLAGFGGTDTVDYSTSSAAVNVNLTTNVNTGGDAEGDKLSAIEKVIGSAYGDTLSSSTSGHILQGGLGDDLYIVGDQGVMVTDGGAAGGGIDEVRTALSALSIAGYEGIEKLTFAGTGSFIGTGNNLANVITGGAGNDTLMGGGGADEFHGGAGTDTVSYADSSAAVIFNFVAGTISGIGTGDTFDGIERLAGSNYGDMFIENGDAHDLLGGGGTDVVSYEISSTAISINLATGIHTGIAVNDKIGDIEVVMATDFNDTLTGSSAANIFIGGAGADTIDGGAGTDGAWYLTSGDAVQIDLLAGAVAGGDATGDTLINIENLIGSGFSDTLTGNASANKLEGADGNDVIHGGDGDDTIYGSIGSNVGPLASLSGVNQSDTLYGGNGNDTIQTATNDIGSIAYGEAGADSIFVNYGTAYGGDGDDQITVLGDGSLNGGAGGVAHGGAGVDILNGEGYLFSLYGEEGADTFNLSNVGEAYGGEGGDTYNVKEKIWIAITDTGTTGIDTVHLDQINFSEAKYKHVGNDLYIYSADAEHEDGSLDYAVYFEGWYAGGNTIEQFVTADGITFLGSQFG